MGPPMPQDWANLLCTQPHDTALIWRAYQELEDFLRAEPSEEALTWWPDFAQKVPLLTESGEFISPHQGIYLPDVSTWYDKFENCLPFLELSGNAWKQYKNLFNTLGLRHLSDELKLEPQTSADLYPEIALKLRQEIAENCSFMYSILAAKTEYDNQAKAEFEPKLAILLRDIDFHVKLVENLAILASIPSHPEIKTITDKKHAFYDTAHKTLYVSILDKKSIPREVGIAVATIFEEFEEKVDSYFAHLFVTSSELAKKKLLKNFKIDYLDWPPPPINIIPPPPIWPEVEPDDIAGKMITLDQWKKIKELTPNIYDPKPSQTEPDESMKQKVGDWGESYAVNCLSQKFCTGYQPVTTTLEWLNATGESGEPFDIKTTNPNGTTYWEVKTTQGEFQEWFMSMQEWMFAAEQGDNYHILRVFNAGTNKAYLVDLQNPVKLWRDNQLTIGHPIRVGLASIATFTP